MTVGVLGCMAERLKHKFLEEEKIVDLVVGPDAYKDIPNLLQEVANEKEGRKCAFIKGRNLWRHRPCTSQLKWSFCFCFDHQRL